MKNVYITFGGRAYDETTARTLADAPSIGASAVMIYDDLWLCQQVDGHLQSFFRVNNWLWETPRKFGFGWCSWKPYIILDAMSRLRTGDVVLYVDADCVPIADLTVLFDIARKDGLWLADCQGFTNRMMTRRDCLIAMGLDRPEISSAKAACARFCAFEVSSFLARQILTEWWAYSINPMCQQWGWGRNAKQYEQPGDVNSKYGEEFADLHRHSTEQSVLAALASKYGIQLYREACGFGWPVDEAYCKANNVIGDAYPQLFEQVDARGPRTLEGSRFRNVPLVGGLP